ncbi:hypothetical protein Psal006b_02821 [Piscirickettsia salmonis]|uniref:Protoheme IX farnesyltransferase n=3 Tax=Piscirickettsia salmonis TaxID=1238 RepID=A0A1L6TGM7_PISSA|nr:hypothetical protein [Piscirickettsia salmonis]AKP72956.2 hypothetical protein PSLF89_890 [Piscirickettsia salmonis LF-89 = ATCC VR-1361]ALB21583.1 protoheme IX farnesyltransferase [Piscirickettsia salmonis]ALY01790.1 hypothetical protein AWE47_02015 [Piscirickettsia salmonis]AMA41301.1 hypothetical protein AWJ11_02000 [Piscirickettsia salmonis]AOS36500.1 hypothetical protein AVM72_14990 [Piscirickettsia salmonis]
MIMKITNHKLNRLKISSYQFLLIISSFFILSILLGYPVLFYLFNYQWVVGLAMPSTVCAYFFYKELTNFRLLKPTTIYFIQLLLTNALFMFLFYFAWASIHPGIAYMIKYPGVSDMINPPPMIHPFLSLKNFFHYIVLYGLSLAFIGAAIISLIVTVCNLVALIIRNLAISSR